MTAVLRPGDRVRASGHPYQPESVGTYQGDHGTRPRPHSVVVDGHDSWLHFAHVEPLGEEGR